MVNSNDVHPLAGFLRDHKSHLERLAATGRPEVLTVEGKARLVVQDAAAYQRMLEVLDAVQAEHVLRERLASIAEDEPGLPAAEVLADLRRRLGIERE